MQLYNIGTINDILRRHNFSFSKALGQNFIVNPTVCPRIAEMGNAKNGFGVIEIGAGIGVLTAELAKRADKVICVEIDKRLLPILDETLAEFDNVKIINNDVLKTDLNKIISEEFEGLDVAICANLPYYITSPILMYLLESRLPVKSITVMVQKEAARRICAKPGTRDVGALSLAVRYYSEPKILFDVSRGSFVPSPDVDSSVIRLDVSAEPTVKVRDSETFFKTIKGGFSQRRKTLVNSLSSYLNVDKNEIVDILTALDIQSTIRPEQLTIEQFAAISDKLCEMERKA